MKNTLKLFSILHSSDAQIGLEKKTVNKKKILNISIKEQLL